MNYPNQHLLVEASWLKENIDNDDLIIVDCMWDEVAYKRAHIKGAIKRPDHPHIKSTDSEGNNSKYLKNIDEFRDFVNELGLRTDKTIVVYDDWDSKLAARFWWICNFYGINNVKLLNGGWQAWLKIEGAISFEEKVLEKESNIELESNSNILATKNYLIKNHANNECQVLDVRSIEEYLGTESRNNKRVGRVPNSKHLEWTDFLTNFENKNAVHYVKPFDEIKDLIDSLKFTSEKEVVTYCQGGVRAAFSAFVFNLMGYKNVRMYDGSMDEWANLDDTPLEV